VLNRVDALASAIRSEAAGTAVVVLVLTGDVAFSGAPEEYELADAFLAQLTSRLKEWVPRLEVVIVPGNHDCDFVSESELRPLLLPQLDTVIDKIVDDRHEVADPILSVQGPFFEFVKRWLSPQPADRLHYRVRLEIDGDLHVRFECLNTAWMSRREEHQGDIKFPPKIVCNTRGPDAGSGSDFVIAIFHHPYAWFDATNRRFVQSELEKNSDLVLTGHEHVSDAYERVSRKATNVQYVEGAVLQSSGHESGFGLLRLDFGRDQQQLLRFDFTGAGYRLLGTDSQPLKRNAGAEGRRFLVTDTFSEELNSMGRGLKHPRRRDLRLRDLFQYPDLRQRPFEKRLQGHQKVPPTTIFGEDLVAHLLRAKKTLIVGPTESGKSALARALYLDLQNEYHLTPVLLNGSRIDGHTADALRRAILSAVGAQYSRAAPDEYNQLLRDKKVLIIDDFNAFPFNAKAQARLLREAENHFDTIVVLADELFRYEELSDEARDVNPFGAYEHCEIRPLGFRLRRQLIRKWVVLGQEYTLSPQHLFDEVEKRERVVDNILRGELIPTYPLFVLLILQAGEVDPNQAVNSGTYGYLNDFLITKALANVRREQTYIGTLSTYLGHVAYALFLTDQEALTSDEFNEITKRYIDDYGMTLSAESLLRDLMNAQILERRNGSIEFRHRHYYYYFVARFFRENLETRRSSTFAQDLSFKLQDVVDNIIFDPYVSILTFYLYFRKDEELIEYLLQSSRRIYSQHGRCNLSSHVDFLNRLYEKKPHRTLSAAHPESARDEMLRDDATITIP
jgi:hypothetical protein